MTQSWKAKIPAGLSKCLALGLATAACTSSTVKAETYGVYDLEAQRLSGPERVRVKDASGRGEMSILVTVDEQGRVEKAEAADNFRRLDPAPALAAARQWTFRPQTFDGRPIRAIGTVSIAYEPEEIPPDPSISFPQLSGEDFSIMLERSACFGNCPDYAVLIDGTGRVTFTSGRSRFPGTAAEVHRMFNGTSVLWPGQHQASIDPAAAAALLEKFRTAHFMGLKPEYTAQITDNPSYALTLRIGKVTKRVGDYVGESVGMPASVTQLENEVDRVAESERWVAGNADTVARLKSAGFDFHGEAAPALVQAAMALSDEERRDATRGLIEAALAQGLDPETRVSKAPGGRPAEAMPLGAAIADYAARAGDGRLFAAMAAKGYVSRMGKGALNAALTSDMGCSPAIARALVAAGADPKTHGEDGNALHALRQSYGSCSKAPAAQRLEMARSLIALGVPLEARNSLGWTVLMGCDDPDLARLLLAAGAKVNARAPDGTTPLLSIDDDRVAILLLRAGADPRARDGDGSVRDQARKHHWPATLAWLDAHGVN